MDYQFIKRIHSGDSFERESIEKYINQGLKEFYIPHDDYKHFTTYLSNELVTKLDKEDQTLDEKIDTIGESFYVAIQEIIKLGFTPATIQLTEAIVENIIKTFQKSHLSLLMLKILNSKHGYIYQHSHLLSVVAGECLRNMQQYTDENLKRLVYAAFFHDITLAEHENLSRIRTYEVLEKSELIEKDWDLVFNHAIEASSLVRSIPEVLHGIDTIIRSHHGSTNGKGFATNSYDKLDLLSKVFIVCEEFVGFLIDYKEKKMEIIPLIADLRNKFNNPDMDLVIKAIESMLKNQKNTRIK
jgi:HD-GYP domain-containing protein (c-di-GMP phosphodiesterase class II)